MFPTNSCDSEGGPHESIEVLLCCCVAVSMVSRVSSISIDPETCIAPVFDVLFSPMQYYITDPIPPNICNAMLHVLVERDSGSTSFRAVLSEIVVTSRLFEVSFMLDPLVL